MVVDAEEIQPEEVGVLFVRQPWADAILEPGGKLVENRGPGAVHWKHRGPLVIASSAKWVDDDQVGEHDLLRELWPEPPHQVGPFGISRGRSIRRRRAGPYRKPPAPFLASTALGVVDLVDVHPEAGCCEPWGETEFVNADGRLVRGATHLVFENAVRFEAPVAGVRGFLGIGRLSRLGEDAAVEVLDRIREARRP